MPLPTDIKFGRAIARYVLAVADTTADTDHDPDPIPASGTVVFTPVANQIVSLASPVTTVGPQPVTCTLVNGELCDPTGNPGVTLVVGAYNVSFKIDSIAVPGFPLVIEDGVTKDLSLEQPLIPLPTQKFVVNEQIYLDTVAARDAAAKSATDAARSALVAAGLPGAVATGVGVKAGALPQDWPNPGAYIAQMDNSDNGWTTVFGSGSGFGTVFTVVLNVNRTFQLVFDKEQNRMWQRTATSATTWAAFVESASRAYVDTAAADLKTGQRLGVYGVNSTGGDFNNLVNDGFYRVSSGTNAPKSGAGWFYILVESHDGANWIKQTATGYTGSGTEDNTYTRQKKNGTWTPWAQVADVFGAFRPDAHDRDLTRSGQWMRATWWNRQVPSTLYTSTWLPSYDDIVGWTPDQIDYVTDATLAGSTAWNRADYYFALLRTVVTISGTASVTVTTGLSVDDRVTVYVDGIVVKTSTTSGPVGGGLSFTLTPGYHVIDIVLYENSGSDYVYGMTPSISSQVNGLHAPQALDLTEEYVRYVGSLQVPRSAATANNQVYIRDANGNPGNLPYAQGTTAYGVPQRDVNGQLNVPTTPTGSSHAGSKAYIDNKGDSAGIVANANASGAITLTEAAQGNGISYRMAMTGDIVFTLPIPADTSHAWTATIRLTQPTAGGAKVTWPSHIKWAGGKPPVLSTAGQAIDIVTLYWDGNIWYGMLSGMAFA